MQNNNSKLNVVLLVILIILVGFVIWFVLNKKDSNLESPIVPNQTQVDDSANKPEPEPNTEESATEVFTKQPGAIKSIQQKGATWQVAVDLLSPNPRWVPGDDSTGRFFINQNLKVRDLVISQETKTYSCDGLENTQTFMSRVQPQINTSIGDFGYTAYFDIEGSRITSFYQQCLP